MLSVVCDSKESNSKKVVAKHYQKYANVQWTLGKLGKVKIQNFEKIIPCALATL